ncbi:MAG: ATP-dependent Clp protease ATP-binding subunit ClpX, partial [Lachnospiraceae bacterium]|nr:ATP-dependent Clp protease ATP-binding subunit ClpX [Lachnospiraceae bacterium]
MFWNMGMPAGMWGAAPNQKKQKDEAKTEKIESEKPVAGENAESEAKESIDESDVEVIDEDEDEDDQAAGQGGIPLGNMGWGIPIGQIDLSALTGKKRVKKKKNKKKELFKLSEIPSPHSIKEQLDEYVIGQDQAKKVISVAVYNHYKRVFERTSPDAAKFDSSVEIEKSNILMIGPTGSGKTYLVKTLAKLLNVPLAIADATSLTEAGYIGDDIESVISKLLAAADNDVEKAEMGIVFIDEIDKIAKKKSTSTRDVSGESVQQELLKLLEGASVEVPVGTSQKNAMTPMETINTDNILFICGGAFPDLENIIKERLTEKISLGFGSELKDKYDKDPKLLSHVTNQDLRNFGMIPEFLGRLPITVTLQGLTKEFLVRILKEPKNAILKQYQKLLQMDEVDLRFDEDALEWIAEEAMKKETGARALRAIMEDFMLDIMYEIPRDPNIGAVTITRAYLEKCGGPRIEMR